MELVTVVWSGKSGGQVFLEEYSGGEGERGEEGEIWRREGGKELLEAHCRLHERN